MSDKRTYNTDQVDAALTVENLMKDDLMDSQKLSDFLDASRLLDMKPNESPIDAAARVLASEVKRLRDESSNRGQELCRLTEELCASRLAIVNRERRLKACIESGFDTP